jgi:hypothetical protein
LSRCFAGGGLDRADAAQGGERGVAGESVGVVAGGDQQRGGGVWADAVAVEQARGAGGDSCEHALLAGADLAG